MLFGFVGLTATVVSFCAVTQPKLEKPLLLGWSPTMVSTFVVGAYGLTVLKNVDRHTPAAAGSGSSRVSSSPPCAHGALIVGANSQFTVAPPPSVIIQGVAAPAPVSPNTNM